jgi:23S rRNA G2069 N7-methylase RlmK/C1962 C5-methylase RlmI
MNLRLSLAGTRFLIKGHPYLRVDQQLSYRLPPPPGTLLKIQDTQGDFLGWCLSDGPGAAPCFRVVSRERRADLGQDWWSALLERALGRRRSLALGPGPKRLVHAEADGLPGLAVDEVDGQLLMSVSSPGVARYLELIEAGLKSLGRQRGLWLRLGVEGAWGPWHRSPLYPDSPSMISMAEGPLRASVNLDQDDRAAVPAWPLARRSVRAWLAQSEGGLFLWGGQAGELELAKAGQKGWRAPGGSLFKAVAGLEPGSQARLLVQVPAASKESFGRFDAVKQGPRLMRDLANAAAPGAQLLLASEHSGLASAAGWEALWREAGLQDQTALEKVFGPEPDLPEFDAWPEGRAPRAYLFRFSGAR